MGTRAVFTFLRRAAKARALALVPALVFSVFAGAASSQQSAPPPAQAPLTALNPVITAESLIADLWLWTCANGGPHQAYMLFSPDGIIYYDYEKPSDFAYDNGRWSFEGGHLMLDYNSGFATDRMDYRVSGDHLIGRASETRRCPFVELKRWPSEISLAPQR